MRRISIMLSAMGSALAPAIAHADEARVSLNSRYIDTTTFNDVFSDKPAVKAEASLDVSEHVYVAGYFYTGTQRIARDDSSEYGAEIGAHWNVGKKTKAVFAAGRYANYQGKGFHAGDWYVRAEVTHGRATASASVLSGNSHTVLLRISYSLPAGKRFSVTPSVVYSTNERSFNPAISAEYRLIKQISVGAQVVAPSNSLTGRRSVAVAASVTWRF